MRILFCWTGVTSYMADCWRALQGAADVELKVIVETAESGRQLAAAETLKGLDCELIDRACAATARIGTLESSFAPDVVFAGGWRSVTTRRVLDRYGDCPQVFCLDMPWRRSLRCLAARFVLRGFVRRFAAAYVPGASAAFYARWLGFPKDRIFRGLYAVDQGRFDAGGRASGGRTGFLFVGRHSPEKRLDVIERAYARYRALGGTWTLDRYGQGGTFVQADGMPSVYAAHACLLLASSFDPWPLVMLEARAAGLEVVASDRCGNCDELGAHKVPCGDAEAMARKMLDVERGARIAPPEGLSAFDVSAWASRTRTVANAARAAAGRGVNGMMVVDSLLRKNGLVAADEVWVHGMWTPDKWWACVRAKLAGKRLVRMTHGSLSPICLERQGKWRKRLVKPMERLCFALADRIVVTGLWELEWARAWGLKRNLEILDLRRFFKFDLEGVAARLKDIPRRTKTSPLKVLYLGRLHPLKGTDALEKAVAELNSECGASGLTTRIELREVSSHFGAELEEDWRWADVLCLPTLSENFGLVVAEALERGVPVVATDGAPAWERQNGVVCLKGYSRENLNRRTGLLKEAFSQILGLVNKED